MIAAFIDRDGTMGGHGGGMHPDEFTMYNFTPRAIKLLNDLKIKVFLFTNQSRVGRGYFSEEDLLRGFKKMQGELKRCEAFIDDFYYCPHKEEDNCNCQKPKIGLLLKAKEDYHLNLKECYVIGDNGSADMIAANKVGAKKVLVRTGWGDSSLNYYRDTWKEVEPDHVAANLEEAIEWIYRDLNQGHKN